MGYKIHENNRADNSITVYTLAAGSLIHIITNKLNNKNAESVMVHSHLYSIVCVCVYVRVCVS